MAEVLIKGLVKKFGKVVAVDGLTLKVKDREFVVLLGPSGCGKTTTLRCIAGLETPDEGEIWIGENLVNDIPPKDRDVAMVFQTYALYPHMTAYENIAFPLRMRKTPKQEIDRKVKEIAEMLGINELLDRKPAQLSGGQQQRVALGAAIIREPQVFLMDEPLSNIDAKLRIYMRTEIKKLQRKLRTTTIYVTHDQVEAMAMADRIAVMNRGKLQQFSSPEELYYNPETSFVANFIGNPPMNLINCSLVEKKGKIFLDAGEFKLDASHFPGVLEKSTSSEVLLGIRPEHIKVLRGGAKGKKDFTASAHTIEPFGDESIVTLKVGDKLLKAKVPEFKIPVGEELGVILNRQKVYIFNSKTGKRMC